MAYLNRNILFFLITGLFIALAYSSPYKDLNIDFLLEDSTKAPIKKQIKSKKKSAEKSFLNVIKDFQIIKIGIAYMMSSQKDMQVWKLELNCQNVAIKLYHI